MLLYYQHQVVTIIVDPSSCLKKQKLMILNWNGTFVQKFCLYQKYYQTSRPNLSIAVIHEIS